VHLVADVEHTDLLQDVFTRHVIDAKSAKQILRGAEESLAIERSFHGAVATAMAEMNE
jgi:DNA-directed RNA polymerase subunit K/omega